MACRRSAAPSCVGEVSTSARRGWRARGRRRGRTRGSCAGIGARVKLSAPARCGARPSRQRPTGEPARCRPAPTVDVVPGAPRRSGFSRMVPGGVDVADAPRRAKLDANQTPPAASAAIGRRLVVGQRERPRASRRARPGSGGAVVSAIHIAPSDARTIVAREVGSLACRARESGVRVDVALRGRRARVRLVGCPRPTCVPSGPVAMTSPSLPEGARRREREPAASTRDDRVRPVLNHAVPVRPERAAGQISGSVDRRPCSKLPVGRVASADRGLVARSRLMRHPGAAVGRGDQRVDRLSRAAHAARRRPPGPVPRTAGQHRQPLG